MKGMVLEYFGPYIYLLHSSTVAASVPPPSPLPFPPLSPPPHVGLETG
jgi:hypothetical protein